MQLKYIGKTIDEVGIVPLPEGWAAEDHDEPDPAIAKAKIAAGNYQKAVKDAETKEEGE